MSRRLMPALHRHRLPLSVAAFGLVVSLAALAWALLPAPRLTVDFLDVGQGDAELLRVGREELLIDGGPDAAVLGGLGESMPLLDRRLEAVLITHPHADHLVGLVHVLEHYEVGIIYYTGANKTPEWQALVTAAEANGVPMAKIAAGQELTVADRRLAVLWPPSNYQLPKGDENYRSAVLCVKSTTSSSCDVLLTGDLPSEVEAQLLKAKSVPASQVLKVGHHGSRTSTSAAFLAVVKPAAAVIEVGKNSYGHPAKATLQRLKKSGANIYQTITDGHLRLTFDKAGAPNITKGIIATWPPIR